MSSAVGPCLSRNQRRRPSRRKRQALMAALLAPLALAGTINPAAAAVMRYSFSGDFSKTPKTGFDWLVGARLQGTMDWDTEKRVFTSWNVKSDRSEWQQQQENIGKQTNPEIVSQIRDLQTRMNYIDNSYSLGKAIDQARIDLAKADPELKPQIEIKIQDLETLKNDVDKGSEEKRQQLKSELQGQIIQLNDSQISFLETKLSYIKNPALLEEVLEKASKDAEDAEVQITALQDELKGALSNGAAIVRPRKDLEQELNAVLQTRAQAETSKAEFSKLNDVTVVERDSLKKALEEDLNLLRLQAKINYLNNPELLEAALSAAEQDKESDPDNLTFNNRFNHLDEIKNEISANDKDPQELKSELQLQLNDLRANQGLSGLGTNPPRPEKSPLFEVSSASANSFCFASPVGAGAAMGGGSFMQGAAGSSLCDGTNGGMMDASFTEEQQTKKPVYFSVIQYFEVPENYKNVSFGFRLAFVPGEEAGKDLELLGMDEFESQPGYGTTFRYGVQQGLEEGRAACRGSADGPEVVASNGGVTTACPFAPDEAGEVAGQPFLSNLQLSYEIVPAQIQPPYVPSVPSTNGTPQPPGEVPAGPQPQPLAQTPAPLPIAGAGAAFAWSRRVRRRYTLVPAKAQIQA